MGKWNNAQFIFSDEIAEFVRAVLKDYRDDDFETFRTRLLYLIDTQLEVKQLLNAAVPDIQEIKSGIDELKTSYQKRIFQEDDYLDDNYQGDGYYPSVTFPDGDFAYQEGVYPRENYQDGAGPNEDESDGKNLEEDGSDGKNLEEDESDGKNLEEDESDGKEPEEADLGGSGLEENELGGDGLDESGSAESYYGGSYISSMFSDEELSRFAGVVVDNLYASDKTEQLDGVIAKVADAVADKLCAKGRADRLDELAARLNQLTARKEKETAPALNIPDYSREIAQLLKAAGELQEQNREILKSVEAVQTDSAEDSGDEAARLREENLSFSRALNKYKTICVKLNNELTEVRNENNEMKMQIDRLQKENAIRIKRQELQDALLARKDREIARLKSGKGEGNAGAAGPAAGQPDGAQ